MLILNDTEETAWVNDQYEGWIDTHENTWWCVYDQFFYERGIIQYHHWVIHSINDIWGP